MKEPRAILDALISEADSTMGCCTSDEALTQLDASYKECYKKKYLGMLPEKKDPLNNLPIDNYIRKFNEGHNSCLDTIRQRMEEN